MHEALNMGLWQEGKLDVARGSRQGVPVGRAALVFLCSLAGYGGGSRRSGMVYPGRRAVAVERFGGRDTASASRDVGIGLPPGRALDVDINSVSGEIRSDFSTDPNRPAEQPPRPLAPQTENANARLRVKTVSGDIAPFRAAGS